MGPERRHALLAWARAGERLIVEDDYEAEFRYDRRPLAALQGLDPARVAYVGTASKTLAPGAAARWMLAPAALAPRARGGEARRRLRLARARPARARAPDRVGRARAPPAPRPPRVRRAPRPARRGAGARACPEGRIEGAAAGVHLVLALPARSTRGGCAAATAAHGVVATTVERAPARAGRRRGAPARARLRPHPDAPASRRRSPRWRRAPHGADADPAPGRLEGRTVGTARAAGATLGGLPMSIASDAPAARHRRAGARLRAALRGPPRGARGAGRRGASPARCAGCTRRAAALRGGDAAAGAALVGARRGSCRDEEVEPCIRACALQLQLANIAEERERVRRRRHYDATGARQRESLHGGRRPAARDGADLAAAVRSLHVELVLTAHPTEATRRSVLDHQLHIARAARRGSTTRASAARRRRVLLGRAARDGHAAGGRPTRCGACARWSRTRSAATCSSSRRRCTTPSRRCSTSSSARSTCASTGASSRFG